MSDFLIYLPGIFTRKLLGGQGKVKIATEWHSNTLSKLFHLNTTHEKISQHFLVAQNWATTYFI